LHYLYYIMTIILKKSVKIKEVYSKMHIHITNSLQKNGIIVGKKNIAGKYTVSIIEFEDYIRIWMLPQELEII